MIKYYAAMKSYSRRHNRAEYLIMTEPFNSFQEAEDICIQEKIKYKNSAFETLSFEDKVNLEGHERGAITYALKNHLVTRDIVVE